MHKLKTNFDKIYQSIIIFNDSLNADDNFSSKPRKPKFLISITKNVSR